MTQGYGDFSACLLDTCTLASRSSKITLGPKPKQDAQIDSTRLGGLDTLNFYSVQPFLAFDNFKGYPVILTDFVDEAGLMHENILVVVVLNDKTKALRFVEELHFACFHKEQVIWNCEKKKNRVKETVMNPDLATGGSRGRK